MSGRRLTIAAAGLVSIAGAVGCPPDGPIESPRTYGSAEEQRIAEVAERLESLDLGIATEKLGVEVTLPKDAAPDLDAMLPLGFSEGHFEAMFHLRRVLEGRPPLRDVAQMRTRLAEARVPRLDAYYTTQRKAMVLMDEARRDLDALESGLARELVFAFHDQAPGGLATMLTADDGTVDGAHVRRCLVEGHSRVVEAAYVYAQAGGDFATATVEEVVIPPQLFLGGEVDVPCPGGIEAMMLRIQEGGWTSLIPSVRGAMLSTEQMLHPTKDGVDFPANVALPRWPTEAGEASLKYETTLGELAIYRLMRERGLDERSARFASIGWDGDRLRIYELPTGEKVTLWRSTWDREDDATQFVTGVSPLSGSALGFRVTRRGRVVDCISAEQDELAELLRKAMDEFVGEPQPQEADAQTTTAIETELARGG